MQLFVRGLSTDVLEVSGEETIGQIKNRLLEVEGVEDAELSLSCEGRLLEDGLLLNTLTCHNLDANVSVKGGEWSIFYAMHKHRIVVLHSNLIVKLDVISEAVRKVDDILALKLVCGTLVDLGCAFFKPPQGDLYVQNYKFQSCEEFINTLGTIFLVLVILIWYNICLQFIIMCALIFGD
jgi:hypothetical protein